jgi:hypothetical protein
MKKIVFLHIPKTGGTSIHDFLVTQIDKQQICPERFNNLNTLPKDDISKYIFFSGHYDIDSINNIAGDKLVFTFFREPKARILSLYYFWKSHKTDIIEKNNLTGPKIAKSLGLLEFLRCREPEIIATIDNYMVRVLAGKMFCGIDGSFLHTKETMIIKSIDSINNMHTFGILEKMNESYHYVLNCLGYESPTIIPHARNSNKLSDPNLEYIEKEEITKEINAELDRLVELDSIIYKYAYDKFNQR